MKSDESIRTIPFVDALDLFRRGEARFAAEALHKEAQIRAAEGREAERIAMRIAHDKAAEAARLQREQMEQWRREASGH